MSARGHSTTPAMMRHGPPGAGAAAGRHPHPLDQTDQLAAQVAEMDRLLLENRRLATTIRAMRQDLSAAQDEIKRVSTHIRSTETESDIQIKVLLEKIGKMESKIKGGDAVKKDLQQAHKEAQSLISVRKELISKIQKANEELETYRADINSIPDMISELDSMRAEHQRLRTAFEHEKNINVDLVERMQSMESKLVAMSREAEMLRTEVLKAEKRAEAPYDGPYPTQDPQYQGLYQSNDPYYHSYRRAHVHTTANGAVEGQVPRTNANSPLPPAGVIPSPPVSGAAAQAAWGGASDPSTARK
ncbi:hypothetical protein vseg_016258 [Gypsophila vaccaria]